MSKPAECPEPNPTPDAKPSATQTTDTSEPEIIFPRRKKSICKCKGFDMLENEKRKKKKKMEGSPFFREKKIWAEFIKKHRNDCKKAKPVVDDKPPALVIPTIYDLEYFKGIRSALKGRFDVNQHMVKVLHDVNVRPGKTDTFTFDYNKSYTTNYSWRKEDARNIEKQNRNMSKLLKKPKLRVQSVKYYAEEWKRHEAAMENSSQFPLFWKVKKEEAVEMAPHVSYFKQFVSQKSGKYSDGRPRVFFEISIRNVGVVGKMVIMLYSDYVPMTCKNFLAFCNPKADLTYKGNKFYLIFEDYYCHTGDVVENRGYGGTSIYGPYFGNEDFTLKHADRGILTMFSKIPNRNNSQFLILFRKLETLDGQNVAFGKVVQGLHVLDTIESLGSKKTGRPKVEIYISDCDEI